MATAALVLGIISLVISVIGGIVASGWIGSICAILAIILGAISRKEKNGKVGMILGIIALCWGIISTIACAACATAMAGGILSSL
ncbi:MAG: hypothetical protein MJ160_04935 [Treponema sp.]|nr:hypothetical protein [Treponema sp.]